MIPDGGADADAIALGDIDLGGLVAPWAPAPGGDAHRSAWDVLGVESHAQLVIEGVDLFVGARDDEARRVGVFVMVAQPVVGKALDRVVDIRAERDLSAFGVRIDGGACVAQADGL